MSLRCARPSGAFGAALVCPRPFPPAAPSKRSGIRWPIVAGAGGVSAFLVLCLTALVWAELRSPRDNPALRLARAAPADPADAAAQILAPEVPWEASGTEEALAAEETPTSFAKLPASPPLPKSAPVELVFGPGLPISERPLAARDGAGEACGTAVRFARDPSEAARQALDEHKLLFTVHLSGNFEDPGFT